MPGLFIMKLCMKILKRERERKLSQKINLCKYILLFVYYLFSFYMHKLLFHYLFLLAKYLNTFFSLYFLFIH